MSADVAAPRRREGVRPLVERRFPLDLHPRLTSVRALYETAKQTRWDPERSIAWKSFAAGSYPAEQLAAARLSWSRRAWCEYGRIAETPALLMRFCLEHAGESDAKMFITVRGTQEIWHLECRTRFAELLGGYVDAPASEAYAQVFDQRLYAEAFDPALPPAAFIAAHSAVRDGLALELHREQLRHATNPVALSILQRLVADKETHAAFGWLFLEETHATWPEGLAQQIGTEIAGALGRIELAGYHCAWLAANDCAADIVAADRITREAGLGACTPDEELAVLTRYLGDARSRLARLGVSLPPVTHPAFGSA